MFDAGSAALIRRAPKIEGINTETLPQELTKTYADLIAYRLRAGDPGADAQRELELDRLLRVASVYEALADSADDLEARRAAAFVSATAYQIVGRVTIGLHATRPSLLAASAIHPSIAAPLLFLIAGQSPDAREAARRLVGDDTDDLLMTAVRESVADLASERFESILQRAERLKHLKSNARNTLDFQATQALYGLCWAGITALASRVLGQPVPSTAFKTFDTPQEAFSQVEYLSVADLALPDEGATLVTSFAGPRHLARLLRQVANGLEGANVVALPPPTGVDAGMWIAWLRHRAKTKPLIWPNHRPPIEAGLLERGRSAVLVLPTGAGKTTVSELKIASALASGRKVIFLAPTLALVDQLRDDLARTFPAELGGITVSSDGDLAVIASGPSLSQIEVMTPERLLAMLSFADADVSDVGLIVFDECHLLSTKGGGSRSLDAMLCVLHAARRAPEADFLLLSAMIQNGQEIADWLGQLTKRPANFFFDPWKPSRQARGVVIYPNAEVARINSYVYAKRQGQKRAKPSLSATPHALFGLQNNWNPGAATDTNIVRLLAEPVTLALGTYGAAPNANQVAAAIAEQSVNAGLKTIVFVQQADYAPTTAKELAAKLDRIADLTPTELSLESEIQTELGPNGQSLVDAGARALPHNGDMLAQERRLAEQLFQRADGANVIVATPTLAQGMNLPAQVAILAGNKRHDDQGRAELQQHELLNAAGRAGRAGFLANGTVLLVPEPVTTFSIAGHPTADAFNKLSSILPANDQCVTVDDPLSHLLDRIQLGLLDNAEVRYLLSRLRAGQTDGNATTPAIQLVENSLGAFQAGRRGQAAEFSQKISALDAALLADTQVVDTDPARIAAFTGLDLAGLQAMGEQIDGDLAALPSTVSGWCDWLVNFLAADDKSLVSLLGRDAETINAVTRGKKAGGPTTADEFERLKGGLSGWVTGLPLDQIEIILGVDQAKIGTCRRSRDLCLKLIPRKFYLLAAAASELAKKKLESASQAAVNPAVLEILPVAIRGGYDSPEQAAFAHRHPHIRTRVGMHRAYADKIGPASPVLGRSFRDVLALIDARLAFGQSE